MTTPEADRSEDDVEPDPHVASSRATDADEDDGSYVGRASSDDDFDSEISGAEARSEDG